MAFNSVASRSMYSAVHINNHACKKKWHKPAVKFYNRNLCCNLCIHRRVVERLHMHSLQSHVNESFWNWWGILTKASFCLNLNCRCALPSNINLRPWVFSITALRNGVQLWNNERTFFSGKSTCMHSTNFSAYRMTLRKMKLVNYLGVLKVYLVHRHLLGWTKNIWFNLCGKHSFQPV